MKQTIATQIRDGNTQIWRDTDSRATLDASLWEEIMARFAFVYHGGKSPESEEEGQKVMAEWMSWYGSMGDAVADGGGPAGPSQTVSGDGVANDGGANPVSGLTIVEAADQSAAAQMAGGCPMVKDGSGSVEVVEILQM